jgi:hypothetical protein
MGTLSVEIKGQLTYCSNLREIHSGKLRPSPNILMGKQQPLVR